MDRLGNIEAFVAAAELGSFTLAARRLRVSPSALSRRISQLEDDLGVRLLHRSTRAMRLSDEGRAYFERSRSALRELAEARGIAARSRERPAGLLRIEAPTILGRFVVVPAIEHMLRRYPEIEIDLALRDHPFDLFADGIDVAVRMGAQADSGLIARRLGTTWLRTCGSRGYLKRHGTPRSIEALQRHERIGFALQGRMVPWRLRDAGAVREVAPSRRLAVNTGDAMIDLAAAGVGLAWMCELMMGSREGGLVEVLPEMVCESTPIHALSLPTRHKLPKVKVFVDLVASELARQGVVT
jgi:DNA-binding transcriptional LysR family regulator